MPQVWMNYSQPHILADGLLNPNCVIHFWTEKDHKDEHYFEYCAIHSHFETHICDKTSSDHFGLKGSREKRVMWRDMKSYDDFIVKIFTGWAILVGKSQIWPYYCNVQQGKQLVEKPCHAGKILRRLKNPAGGRPFETFECIPIRMKQSECDLAVTFSEKWTVWFKLKFTWYRDVLCDFHGQTASQREHTHRSDLVFLGSRWFLSHCAISGSQLEKNRFWNWTVDPGEGFSTNCMNNSPEVRKSMAQ
jgi:hypothetical protein